MPRLSDSMSEATIMTWLKQPGETFARGDPLVEVETDKATVVYEAESDGLLGEILVSEGETAELGAPIARLGGVGAATETAPAAAIGAPQAGAAEPLGSPPGPDRPQRVRATPVARRTAAQLGVRPPRPHRYGPDGRIRQLDVLRGGSSAPSPPVPATSKGPRRSLR